MANISTTTGDWQEHNRQGSEQNLIKCSLAGVYIVGAVEPSKKEYLVAVSVTEAFTIDYIGYTNGSVTDSGRKNIPSESMDYNGRTIHYLVCGPWYSPKPEPQISTCTCEDSIDSARYNGIKYIMDIVGTIHVDDFSEQANTHNIRIKFDTQGTPLPLRMILATKSGRMIREMPINKIKFTDNLGNGSEVSFSVYKSRCVKADGETDTAFWEKIDNLRLAYCPEFDAFYELNVEFTDATETVKAVTATSLGEAELSQIMVYGIEVNTEADIARDDYAPTVLYNENDKSASLIDRLLYKAPHYRVGHVDDTIRNIQRTFTFDNKTVYDAFQEIAQEVGCLFRYDCRRNLKQEENEYKDARYYTEEFSMLICTLAGRTYTKINTGGAYLAYGYWGGYTRPLLVSENANAVDYKTSYNGSILHADTSFRYKNGKTFYASGNAYAMQGDHSSTGGFAIRLEGTYGSIEEAASALLDIVYANPTYIPDNRIENNIIREVNVYDLWNTCMDCGNRGEFMEVCDECGSTNIREGYGKDTRIYVDKDNLADEIVFSTEVGKIKNCFRLTAGDDLMTAAIISCNPNGSQYLWYIPDYMQEDMSDALKERLNQYNELYDYYQKEHTISVARIVPEE